MLHGVRHTPYKRKRRVYVDKNGSPQLHPTKSPPCLTPSELRLISDESNKENIPPEYLSDVSSTGATNGTHTPQTLLPSLPTPRQTPLPRIMIKPNPHKQSPRLSKRFIRSPSHISDSETERERTRRQEHISDSKPERERTRRQEAEREQCLQRIPLPHIVITPRQRERLCRLRKQFNCWPSHSSDYEREREPRARCEKAEREQSLRIAREIVAPLNAIARVRESSKRQQSQPTAAPLKAIAPSAATDTCNNQLVHQKCEKKVTNSTFDGSEVALNVPRRRRLPRWNDRDSDFPESRKVYYRRRRYWFGEVATFEADRARRIANGTIGIDSEEDKA
ncbi:hypothetical protein PHLCEN_2v12603 [Hermanssonia centrifuga]|uniref:Uncharacterized protein n=1 Tax=Hermanssonia centrifuga TaxID=98765 RepID=A0A2R6NGK4_9APHY|nr:hypothetical protein PHLCEN_2v12603 [Hermanssonia centrifuga]